MDANQDKNNSNQAKQKLKFRISEVSSNFNNNLNF